MESCRKSTRITNLLCRLLQTVRSVAGLQPKRLRFSYSQYTSRMDVIANTLAFFGPDDLHPLM